MRFGQLAIIGTRDLLVDTGIAGVRSESQRKVAT
jgi:hypothetical protein